jgi:PTS system nitrogen regulatory IIA component
MDIKLLDAARILNVDADEIVRWIRERGFPAHRVQDQFRINSVELQEWALAQGLKVPPDLLAINRNRPGAADLASALERGGMHVDVPGSSIDEVLAAIVQLPGIPGGIDRELLRELLIAREALSSTGVGNGIAVPHPRSPIALDVALPPTLLACFLKSPVDFNAIDGKPVWLVFLLLSPTIQEHLRLLSQLSYALHDAPIRSMLSQRAPLALVLARIGELAATPPVPAKAK